MVIQNKTNKPWLQWKKTFKVSGGKLKVEQIRLIQNREEFIKYKIF